MKTLFNLHTHSKFCDGAGDPEAYVISAMAKGFHSLGFSSHAPVPFKNNFAIRDDHEIREYCTIIRDLREKYKDQISIRLALEIDFIEGITRDFKDFKLACRLDYTIGSVHLVKNGYDDRLWFIDGPKVETYDDGLKNIFGGDIRLAVTLSSDAHRPEEIDGYFPELRLLVSHCQFSDCTHVHEPGCAVLSAMSGGQIHPERYQSYLRMRFGDQVDAPAEGLQR